LDRVRKLSSDSSASADATSPALWPPMPSATAYRPSRSSTSMPSSLWSRTLPRCVAPYPDSIRSPSVARGATILTRPQDAATRMLTLLYTRDGRTCRHELTPGDTIVGRASICDLTIEDPSISRRHARFRFHGERCVLTDLGGRNGTFLNGEQVTEAQVHPGDAI